MTKAQRERKLKIQFFLTFYFLYTFLKVVLANFRAFSAFFKPLHPLIAAMMWGACLVVTMASNKRKIFHSKAVMFFFAGTSMWLLWCAFIIFSGTSMLSGIMKYRELAALSVFIHTVFMSSRIIELYDLRRKVVGITVFCLGLSLVLAFVIFFDGFDFINSLAGIFLAGGRYRFTYGYTHPNYTGEACLQFFIFSVAYMAIVKEEKKIHKIRKWGGVKFLT